MHETAPQPNALLTTIWRTSRPCSSGRFPQPACRPSTCIPLVAPPTTPMKYSEYLLSLYLFVSLHRTPGTPSPSAIPRAAAQLSQTPLPIPVLVPHVLFPLGTLSCKHGRRVERTTRPNSIPSRPNGHVVPLVSILRRPFPLCEPTSRRAWPHRHRHRPLAVAVILRRCPSAPIPDPCRRARVDGVVDVPSSRSSGHRCEIRTLGGDEQENNSPSGGMAPAAGADGGDANIATPADAITDAARIQRR